MLLRNAVVEFSPNTRRSLYLPNNEDMPVHLTNGYVVGTATAYNGPLHVVADEGEPGAVITIRGGTLDKTVHEVNTGHRAD